MPGRWHLKIAHKVNIADQCERDFERLTFAYFLTNRHF